MTDRVDRYGAALLALLAATAAAFIFGTVAPYPFGEHTFAYATMSLVMGVLVAAAWYLLIEYVLTPVVDRLWEIRNARAERAHARKMERIYRSWSVTRDQR